MEAATRTRDADVVVIGAGAAGMASASLCARAGLRTLVLDERRALGGRSHRAILETPLTDRRVLGREYWAGERLAREFLSSGAEHVPLCRVHAISTDLVVEARTAEGRLAIDAKRVIIATGAVERAFPIPGDDLRGVAPAETAEAALVERGEAPEGPIVLAGSGPLLPLAATRLLAAGAPLHAVLDTTPRRGLARSLSAVPAFALSRQFRQRAALWRRLRSRIAVLHGVSGIAASGEGRLEAVRFVAEDGSSASLAAATLVLHPGLVPDTTLTRAAGLPHRHDARRDCEIPVVDRDGHAPAPGVYVAGGAIGACDASVAAWRGVIAAATIVREVQPRIARPAERLARSAIAALQRGQWFAER